jgi:hypothetical protein
MGIVRTEAAEPDFRQERKNEFLNEKNLLSEFITITFLEISRTAFHP